MTSNQNTNNPASGSPAQPTREQIETWAALLARWTAFAQAAVALPESEESVRWRRAVAPVIRLQAITHALAELDTLPTDERALGLDRAAHLIRDDAGALHEAWRAEPLPDRLAELIEDARTAHAAAAAHGAHWIAGEDRLVMPRIDNAARALVERGFAGDLLAATPGTILFRGEPAIFARPVPGAASPVEIPGLQRVDRPGPPLQIYRQIDGRTGLVSRDLVTPLDGSLPPGRPLLLPLIESGRLKPTPSDAEIASWRAQQDRTIAGRDVPIAWPGEGS